MVGVVPPRGAALDATAFRAVEGATWERLAEVKGTNAKPTWYSPGASKLYEGIADLRLLKFSAQHRLMHAVPKAWLCCLMQVGLIVRDKSSKQGQGAWHMIVGGMSNMSVLAWLVVEVRVGNDKIYHLASEGGPLASACSSCWTSRIGRLVGVGGARRCIKCCSTVRRPTSPR